MEEKSLVKFTLYTIGAGVTGILFYMEYIKY